MKNFGENKIRITLNISDLAEKNIDFHEFMSNPIDSQSLFMDMLDQAEKEIGFVTKNCKIMIEALAMSSGNFVLTVTRVLPETEKSVTSPRKKIKVKRKTNNINCVIFEFLSFDDFYDFEMSLTSSLFNKISKSISNSKLYLYNQKYYLIFDKLPENSEFIKVLSASVSEFGKFVSSSDTYKNKIIEHGKIMIKKNAIISCNNRFKQKNM